MIYVRVRRIWSRGQDMNKNASKKKGIYVLAGVILIVVIVAVAVLVSGNNTSSSSEEPDPIFTDEEGEIYVAAFLKGMTESTVTVDVIEFITETDRDRIEELDLTNDDMLDGYYIYNPDTEMKIWNLDAQTVCIFIDWNGDFTGSEYPEEYTTTDVQEFRDYIETYENAAPGMPFFFQVENQVVKLILERPMA